MQIDRRGFLGRSVLALALGVGLLAGAAPSGASAATPEAAQKHVAATIAEVLALVESPGSAEAKAPQLRRIIEVRASLPQIAQAVAGPLWRQMDATQQARFVDAFADYIATIYARRFQEYQGQQINVGRVRDAGTKGFLVQSAVEGDETPILVEWLVSDRGGRLAVNDIVIEGVSMVISQREQIASMLHSRGNDVEGLISALRSV